LSKGKRIGGEEPLNPEKRGKRKSGPQQNEKKGKKTGLVASGPKSQKEKRFEQKRKKRKRTWKDESAILSLLERKKKL